MEWNEGMMGKVVGMGGVSRGEGEFVVGIMERGG